MRRWVGLFLTGALPRVAAPAKVPRAMRKGAHVLAVRAAAPETIGFGQ